jgi:diguanylate cyclase (GGDEF)-like protein
VERIEPKLTPAVVLIIDDDPERARAVANAIRGAFGHAVIRTRGWSDLRTSARDSFADLVILTPREGHSAADRGRSLPAILSELKHIPTIVLASAKDPQSAVNAVLDGASDALVMQERYLDLLPARVSHTLARARFRPVSERRRGKNGSALQRTREENRRLRSHVNTLQVAAMLDPLTGLCNRRAMDARLADLWDAAVVTQGELSCLVIDIDHFKRVNDTYGHAIGDLVLTLLARVLVEQCRHDDVAARYGGDEFVALLSNASVEQARLVAQRLQAAFDRAVLASHESVRALRPTLSIGVSSRCSNAPTSADDLLAHADAALYTSKHEGRNRISVAIGTGAAPVRLAAAG